MPICSVIIDMRLGPGLGPKQGVAHSAGKKSAKAMELDFRTPRCKWRWGGTRAIRQREIDIVIDIVIGGRQYTHLSTV